jgi:hypothetical protein
VPEDPLPSGTFNLGAYLGHYRPDCNTAPHPGERRQKIAQEDAVFWCSVEAADERKYPVRAGEGVGK